MIEDFIGTTAEFMGKYLNYPEHTIQMLDESKFNWYMDTNKRLRDIHNGNKFGADVRRPFTFQRAITLNWLLEDYIIGVLNRNTEFKYANNAVDKNRELLPYRKVVIDPDVIVSVDGKDIEFDVISTSQGYIDNLYMRGNKLQKMKERSKVNPVFIMGIDYKNKKYFLVDVNDMESYDDVEFNKPCQRVYFSCFADEIKDFTKDNLQKDTSNKFRSALEAK